MHVIAHSTEQHHPFRPPYMSCKNPAVKNG